jgi:hypothetical protein
MEVYSSRIITPTWHTALKNGLSEIHGNASVSLRSAELFQSIGVAVNLVETGADSLELLKPDSGRSGRWKR